MSLWAEYRAERKESIFIEHENGFASYNFSADGKDCYLQDIYVRKDFRKTGLATQLADEVVEIAKARDCEYLTGSVIVGSVEDTKSMKVFLAYGMKLHSVQGNIVYLYKKLTEEK